MSDQMSELISEVIDQLRRQGQTLSTAESLTGGGVGAALTSIPGASDVFLGGITAYAQEIKSSVLGVDPSIIATHGVVSKEVATAMADAALSKFGSTWAISTTGVAGPGPQGDLAAGTVWIAVAGPRAFEFLHGFNGERHEVQNATITSAIEHFARILREFI